MSLVPGFSTVPLQEDMVVEACPTPGRMGSALDVLCVRCGWEGHVKPHERPWPVFRDHVCRLRVHSVSNSD